MPINKTEVFVYSPADSTGDKKSSGGTDATASELQLSCSSQSEALSAWCWEVHVSLVAAQQVVKFCTDIMRRFSSTAGLVTLHHFLFRKELMRGNQLEKKQRKTSGSSPHSTGIPLLQRQRSQEKVDNSLGTKVSCKTEMMAQPGVIPARIPSTVQYATLALFPIV